MGLLGNIIAGKALQKVGQRMNQRRAEGDYIPAGSPATTAGTGLQSTANAALTRAGEFYKQNPKMVAGLGVAAALMALSALKRRQF
jgi:hypothetical protein